MLKEKINEDLKVAMKAGNRFSLDVLRGLNAAFHNKSIEKRGKGLSEDLAEEEIWEILNKEIKKRRDAVALYKQGNRNDLAEKEQKEIFIIQKYLPDQLSLGEITKKIDDIISKAPNKEFNVVIKEVMKELRGRADSKLIVDIVKEKIG